MRRILVGIVTVYLFATLAAALFAPLLTRYDPAAQDLNARLQPPGTAGHLLGTDDLGRDVFSRVLHGTRPALVVGVVSVSIAVAIGLILGLVAGLTGRAADSSIMLLMDSILSFPTVLLAITVVAVLGYGLLQVIAAIGVVFSPLFARIVRAEALSIRTEGYVESSRALGSHPLTTVFLHIVPNMLPKLIVQASATFAIAIVIEASLSFLGIGMQPPAASWGLMLKDARNYLIQAPWLALYPGLALGLMVFSFNVLGDALADYFERSS